MSVKRYDVEADRGGTFSVEREDGEYVTYADYQELEGERDALREWRFWLCERIGMSCAAGATWTVEDVIAHVADIEHRAERRALQSPEVPRG